MATRKKKAGFGRHDLVRLYLEDVEQIAEALEGFAPETLRVSNGQWEAESVAELLDKGAGPFTEFRIDGGRGSVYAEVSPLGAMTFASDLGDLALRGAFETMEAIVRSAQMPLWRRWIYSGPAMGLVSVVALVGLVAFASLALEGELTILSALGWLALALGGVACLLHGHRTALQRGGLVYLVRRDERPNFIQRNRDALAVNLLTTLLGAMLGFVAGWLANR